MTWLQVLALTATYFALVPVRATPKRVLPRYLYVHTPGTTFLEVLDARGLPVPRVHRVDTAQKVAWQYSSYSSRQTSPVPYAQLRMVDGRSVLDVFGVDT